MSDAPGYTQVGRGQRVVPEDYEPEHEAPADIIIVGRPGDTVYLAIPLSERAREHFGALAEYPDEHSFVGEGLAIEHRYLDPWVEGMRSEGYVIRPA